MQRVCPKCNTLVTGDGAFCPSCGEPLPAAVDLGKPDGASQSVQFSAPDPHQGTMPNYGAQNTGYSQNNGYSQGYQNQNTTTQYGSSQPIVNNGEMTLGQWVGTVILTTWFGIISLILCIVWGVSNDTPIAKKRYCQAMIIIQCISIAVSIIFMIVFFSILGAAGGSFANAMQEAWEIYPM